MKNNSTHILIAVTFCCALILLLFGMEIPAIAGTVDSSLRIKISSLGSSDEIPVIIKLTGKADLEKIKEKEKSARREKIIKTLRETADISQKQIRAFLEKKKAKKLRQLWIINGLAATVPAALIDELANFPGVEAVMLDAVIHAPVTTYSTAAAPEWNITAIHAQELWNLGYTGQGVVVANMDSGVDLGHPDLQGRWRGGTNSWFDPNGEHATPADVNGHGTQTMGIMVGGDAGGSSIGVAPGSTWIAVKIFNDAGETRFSTIHQGYQWLLDPDQNPATNDAPDVVNNSWGLEGLGHGCITEFQTGIQTLKAAGIALTFSAGNDGPDPATSVSPANYPESFSVGAVDSINSIAFTSSRGPSACGGDIYPNVVAPGANVWTSDLNLGVPGAAYALVDGTSFASPHVAGAMALLLSAFPGQSVAMLENAIAKTATDLGDLGTDNAYGNGLLNISGAYRYLRTDRIGVYHDRMWYADYNGNGVWDGTPTDRTSWHGFPGGIPLTGDWNGDGKTENGIYDPGTAQWYLDYNGNGLWDGTPTDTIYWHGFTGVTPVTGDWNGDGITEIGVYDPATTQWYLDYNGNGLWDGTPNDVIYWHGFTGITPVTGDWNGDGKTEIGVYDPATAQWYLDYNGNGLWDGTPTDRIYWHGFTGIIPVTGDWNGDGKTEIGVYDPSTAQWYLDYNGNGLWEGTPADLIYWHGFAGVTPVTGRW